VHLKVKQANKASGTKRIGTITYLAYGFGCRSCLGT
jgi:hypothetical protein